MLGLVKYLPILALNFNKGTGMQPCQIALSAVLKVYEMVNIKSNLRVADQKNQVYSSDE